MSGPTAAFQPKTDANTGSWSSYQDRRAGTGFSRNAPDGVTSNATFEPPLIPYFFRNGAGIVTRPRVENFTR
jgi:hypothetical protein